MAKTKVREILKSEESTGEKLNYLWSYYKWHVAIFLVGLGFAVFMINDWVNRPISYFHVAVLAPEVNFDEEEALAQDMTELLQPEGANERVFVSFTPPGRLYERFVAQFSAGEYDVVMMDEEFYEQYSDSGSMQQFRLNGIDGEAFYQPDIYDNPIGVESSQVPLFEEYNSTDDLIMMIPGNSERQDRIAEFFETQGFVIELID